MPLDKSAISKKYFPYFSTKEYVGTQKNRLKTILF